MRPGAPPNPDPPDDPELMIENNKLSLVDKIRNISIRDIFLIISIICVLILSLGKIFTRDMTDKMTDQITFTKWEMLWSNLYFIAIDILLCVAFAFGRLMEFYKRRVRLYKFLALYQLFILVFDFSCLWVKSWEALLYKLNNPIWISLSIGFILTILTIVILTKNE